MMPLVLNSNYHSLFLSSDISEPKNFVFAICPNNKYETFNFLARDFVHCVLCVNEEKIN